MNAAKIVTVSLLVVAQCIAVTPLFSLYEKDDIGGVNIGTYKDDFWMYNGSCGCKNFGRPFPYSLDFSDGDDDDGDSGYYSNDYNSDYYNYGPPYDYGYDVGYPNYNWHNFHRGWNRWPERDWWHHNWQHRGSHNDWHHHDWDHGWHHSSHRGGGGGHHR